MAEQEACTELVEKASQEQSTGAIEGESLLLPLLQGLLEAPENEQTADSGTESGEDQRSGLIAEVQNALEKLSVSLLNDATDITPERRSSLLQLVTKLQSGLASTTPKLERRLSSGAGRFTRRRNRQNRHTVGVSSEELADARRLIEEISIHELTPSSSQQKVPSLEKQNSESSVASNLSFTKFNPKQTVKNATAKPFSSSSNSISNASSSVQTPTEPSENLESLFAEEATYYEAPPIQMRDKKPNYAITHSTSITSLEQETQRNRRPLSESISLEASQDVDAIRIVHHTVQQAAVRKKSSSESAVDSETEEEDTSTVKDKDHMLDINDAPSPHRENPVYVKPGELSSESSPSSYEDKVRRFDTTSRKLKVKRANTIDIPKALLLCADEDSECSDLEEDERQKSNSFYGLKGTVGVKPNKVKDSIPIFQPKTESDQKFLAFLNRNNENTVNKANPWTPQNKTPMWGNKFGNIKNNFEKTSGAPSANSAKSFWKTQDDATAMGTPAQFGPRISRRSARNLQQMFEEKQRSSQEKIAPHQQPNVVTGTLRVQTGPHQDQKHTVTGSFRVPQEQKHVVTGSFKLPQDQKHVVTGSFKVPQEPNHVVTGNLKVKTEPESNYKFIHQPLPVNKFSHAPQSAFKPIPRKEPWKSETEPKREPPKPLSLQIKPNKEIVKTEIKESNNDPPLYLYSPKPLNSQTGSATTSPVISKPWVTNATEHGGRVLSMAAKKFENSLQQDSYQLKPKKLNKDINQIFVSPQTQPEKITAPYLSRSAEPKNGSVRKLSGQYDSFGVKESDYAGNKKVDAPMKKPYSTYAGIKQVPATFQNQTQRQFPTPNYASNVSHSYHSAQHQPVPQSPQKQNHPAQNFNYINQQQQNYKPQTYQGLPKTTENFQPVNYTVVYDKPHVEPNNMSPQIEARAQAPQHIFQHVPGRDDLPDVYTSTLQFKPSSKQQNQVPVQVIEPVVQPPKLETQLSSDSVHEYTAISSKVMTGPVSQQAVTVKQKSPMSRNQHDMEAAFQLKNVLQKVNKNDISPPNKSPTQKSPFRNDDVPSSPSSSFKYKANVSQPVSPHSSFKYKSSEPQSMKTKELQNMFQEPQSPNAYNKYNPSDVPKPMVAMSNLRSKFEIGSKVNPTDTKTYGVVKPMQQKPAASKPIYNNVSRVQKPEQSLVINERGQSILTSKFHIPVINVAPTSPGVNLPTQGNALSKSDSWHQICMANQPQYRPQASNASSDRSIRKSKSSHSLAVPQKQFEAGITRDELQYKKKTIEAYFSGDSKSPSPQPEAKSVKRSINRIKTSDKTSAYRQSSGVLRSRTLPDLVCPDLLDESNIDEAFDELFNTSS